MDGVKIRAIVKRPDERYGHVTNISCTLKNLQKTVDGHFEVVRLSEEVVMIVNEEGKILGLPKNFQMGKWPYCDTIVGTVAVLGVDGEEFCDCPMAFKAWKRLLEEWDNL